MLLADDWKDYELIDTGGGEKLERWGQYTLRRPDPQAIWPITGNEKAWARADAHYHRSSGGGGNWEYLKKLPQQWTIRHGELEFYVEPTGFKHTGLFPEQAVNWNWMEQKIEGAGRKVSVLNLFAYTGGATVATAHAGAEVCHVDAAKGMVARAKENLTLSKLADKPVRFIVDDVVKFVNREIRRDRKYDAVIMDPPSYGRGPNGELWKIEDELFGLIGLCMDVLTPEPLFFLVNSYTTGLSPTVIGNMLRLSVQKKYGGSVNADEVGLRATATGLVLPCGAAGRWEA
ncbi:MAG TPA: class I SAM-dependent methyltransferase [Clostridia bacterium]|nr:class I SAM-dependent methyltransferase [Clostridia bacterium]